MFEFFKYFIVTLLIRKITNIMYNKYTRLDKNILVSRNNTIKMLKSYIIHTVKILHVTSKQFHWRQTVKNRISC